MSLIVTLFIFTICFALAAEYAWWGPQRRTRIEIEQRLRGLRVDGGRRPGAVLRQQASGGSGFGHRLEMMQRLQATIDQAKLPYRAGNVITLSLMTLGVAYLVADI